MALLAALMFLGAFGSPILALPTLQEHASTRALLLNSSNSSNCSFPYQHFTQNIDHSGLHNGTFQQGYRISAEFYQPGGPILLFEGEESTTLDCLESTIMYDFARELNGIAVALEHRYFGASKPFGRNLTQYTPQQWSFLTLDNVMEDAVQFIESVKRNVSGSEDAPVFAASGSYGGFLMTMFRQNHPETFDGVIASAPAIRSFYGQSQGDVPGEYNWWNYVSRVYRERSSEAAAKIKEAFDVLRERFASNNISGLHTELNLCTPLPDNSSTTLFTLTPFLTQAFGDGSEFNYAVARLGRSPIAWPLDRFVEIALQEDAPLQIINRTVHLWSSSSAASANIPYSCVDIYDPESLSVLAAPLIEVLPFQYITCSYLSFDASSIASPDSLFPPTESPSLTHEEFRTFCLDKYGVSAPTSDEIYSRYLFTTAELQNSTGIIFSLGEYDQTTSVSGYYDFTIPLRADSYASRRIFTSGMAHREDLFAWDNATKPTVRATNLEELEILKEWMAISKERRAGAV